MSQEETRGLYGRTMPGINNFNCGKTELPMMMLNGEKAHQGGRIIDGGTVI